MAKFLRFLQESLRVPEKIFKIDVVDSTIPSRVPTVTKFAPKILTKNQGKTE